MVHLGLVFSTCAVGTNPTAIARETGQTGIAIAMDCGIEPVAGTWIGGDERG